MESCLNPVQTADLVTILSLTLRKRRLAVALAFAGKTNLDLAQTLGLTSITHWHTRDLSPGKSRVTLHPTMQSIADYFGVTVETIFKD